MASGIPQTWVNPKKLVKVAHIPQETRIMPTMSSHTSANGLRLGRKTHARDDPTGTHSPMWLSACLWSSELATLRTTTDLDTIVNSAMRAVGAQMTFTTLHSQWNRHGGSHKPRSPMHKTLFTVPMVFQGVLQHPLGTRRHFDDHSPWEMSTGASHERRERRI